MRHETAALRVAARPLSMPRARSARGGGRRRWACGSAWLSLVVLAALGAVLALARPALAALGQWSLLGLAGLPVNDVLLAPDDARVVLAATNGQGVFRSEDGGDVFGGRNGGLASFIVRDLAVDPSAPNVVFAATGRSPAVAESAGLHRSVDGGRTWRLVLEGFTGAVAIDPTDPRVVYAGGAPPIRKSLDQGQTWFDPQTGPRIENIDVMAVAVNPADPRIILAGGVTEGGAGQLFRSTDAGASWQPVLVLEDGVNALAFATGQVAFLGAGTIGEEAGVWRSLDAGLTWQRVTEDEFGDVIVHDVVVNPLNNQIIYAATSGRGIIRSTDGGATWLELNPSLGTLSTRSLAITSTAPQTLYAGTDDGVWAFTIAEPQFAEPTVVLAPARAQAGEPVRVRAEAFTQVASSTQCIGLRGPAQNLGFGLAPAFNVHLATLDLDSQGRGENLVTIPPTLPPGPYEIVVGPCQRQRGIAPLTGPTAQLAVGAVTRFFAEGSTQPGFDTWFLLQNPGAQPVTATLTLIDGSGASRAFVHQLPPASRTSILANTLLPGVPISARLDATGQVFAERAQYFGPDGHVSTALPAPARHWFLAEGSSQGEFKTWVLVQNPAPQPAQVTFTFQLEGGGTRTFQATVDPTSRFTLLANDIVPGTDFSTFVESDVPVVVERAFLIGPIGAPVGGHGAPGTTTPSTRWFFGEGSSQPSVPGQPFRTFVLLQNPQPRPVGATVRFLPATGRGIDLPVTIAPNARATVSANLMLPDEAFGVEVIADEPIVAERSMFFGPGGMAAHDTLGALAPAHRWQLAEGSTAAPFETWVLVANPNAQPTDVTLTFTAEDGRVVERSATVPANSRQTFLVNEVVPDAAGVSTTVSSVLPVVVERSMYFHGRAGGTNTIGIPLD